MHDAVDPKVEKQMRAFAEALSQMLNGQPLGAKNPKYGFTLLVFDFGQEGRMNYMSNAQRKEMIIALKECIYMLEGGVPFSEKKQ